MTALLATFSWQELRLHPWRHAMAVLAVMLGYVLEWAFFSFLYEREHLQQVLMTYGLILVFEELRSLAVGDDVHGVQPPPLLAALRLGCHLQRGTGEHRGHRQPS